MKKRSYIMRQKENEEVFKKSENIFPSKMTLLRSFLGNYLIILIMLVLFGAGIILSPYFLTGTNVINILLQSAINSIIAIGMTFVIITGGIDLSVGSVLALSGVVMASLSHRGFSVILVIISGILIGIICGFINGSLITKWKLAPFIATLGMMSIARGLALIYTGGLTMYGLSSSFTILGSGYLGSIPIAVIITFIIFFIAYFILKYTKVGLYVYAIGSNEEATRLCGISVNKYKLLVYIISGICASIAGIILTGRLNAAEPIAGSGYELNAIAAAVIGGCSLAGGEGNLLGTLVGAIIMGILQNLLNLTNVQAYYQQLVIGLVIVGAVLVDTFRKR